MNKGARNSSSADIPAELTLTLTRQSSALMQFPGTAQGADSRTIGSPGDTPAIPAFRRAISYVGRPQGFDVFGGKMGIPDIKTPEVNLNLDFDQFTHFSPTLTRGVSSEAKVANGRATPVDVADAAKALLIMEQSNFGAAANKKARLFSRKTSQKRKYSVVEAACRISDDEEAMDAEEMLSEMPLGGHLLRQRSRSGSRTPSAPPPVNVRFAKRANVNGEPLPRPTTGGPRHDREPSAARRETVNGLRVPYTREERWRRAEMWFQRRRVQWANTEKSVVYECRQQFASSRKRVGGRFVKKTDEEKARDKKIKAERAAALRKQKREAKEAARQSFAELQTGGALY